MLHWRSSALLRVLRLCSLVLQASVPVVLHRDWALVPSVVLRPRVGAGAPPRDIAGGAPHLDGAGGLHSLERGGQANLRGIEGRAAAYSANSYTHNGYASYGRGYRHWPYAAAAACAYGGSYASSDDGCYYVSTYRRYGTRRVLVCHGN
jgi:hypothetical protein